VLADELSVIDADSRLWSAARPLLDNALRLEQQDETYIWHGWRKSQVNAFLQSLPVHCTLLVGVWGTSEEDREQLILGCACEVVEGEICTIRTFEALADPDLPSVHELEPGFEHALALMRVARISIAPDEWLFAAGEDEGEIDKGTVLASFAQQGRCVLLGSQASHHH
jgi:hypothetical protein